MRIMLIIVAALCSAVWGVGGNIDASTWDKWDPFVRELFEGTANYPGGSGSVFDYFLEPSRCEA